MRRALDLLRGRWRCHGCDEEHEGLMGLSAMSPWQWGNPAEPEPNDALRMDGYFLSEDFCVIEGAHFFIRGVFDIKVHGLDEPFTLGAWSTLSRTNFETYVDGFNDDAPEADHDWTGWFSTDLEPFPSSINLPCWVEPRANRQRPLLWLADGDHPLFLAQRDGITPEQLLDIYRANGHPVD